MPAKRKSRKSASVVQSQAAKSVARSKTTRSKTKEPLLKAPARPTRLARKMVQESLRLGRARADKILASRAKALRGRAEVFAFGSAGLLIFEGDSWFDFLGTDIRHVLKDLGYEVPSDAHAGDRIEEMVGQLQGLQRLIEGQTRVPKAVLLSGGGNDIVLNEHKEFTNLLNPASSPNPGWNPTELTKRIDGDLQRFYLEMLSSVTQFCKRKWGRAVPILIHGYAHPVPDGSKALWKGPWLQPVFKAQGYVDGTGEVDLEVCTPLIRDLIDRFNTMLHGLPAAPGLDHVTHVDLRPALSSGTDFKVWWDNELHPTEEGFVKVTQRFVDVLKLLP